MLPNVQLTKKGSKEYKELSASIAALSKKK